MNDSDSFRTVESTNRLRYVVRDGKQVLQQLWRVTGIDKFDTPYRGHEWQDVPVKDEV